MAQLNTAILLNSALYLIAVVYTALVIDRPIAWKLGIASMGVTYLCYVAQLMFPQHRKGALVLVYSSMALGAAAGLALL